MIAFLIALILLVATPAVAQVHQPGFTCQNHGTTLNFAPILNCGSGTTCAWTAPGICTVTASGGGGGTVTNIATTLPITGGPITTTGTIGANTFGASGASHARGVVPDPGSSAGTTKFLREDATWVVPPSSPPGGSNGQIQYNNAGAFGGFGNFDGADVTVPGGLFVPVENGLSVTGAAWFGFNTPGFPEIVTGGASLNNAGLFAGLNSDLTIHSNASFARFGLTFWNDADGIANASAITMSGVYPNNTLEIDFGDGAGGTVPQSQLVLSPGNNNMAALNAAATWLARVQTFVDTTGNLPFAAIFAQDAAVTNRALVNANVTADGVNVHLESRNAAGITSVHIWPPLFGERGTVDIESSAVGTSRLQFFDAANTNTVSLQAPDTITPRTGLALQLRLPAAAPAVTAQPLVGLLDVDGLHVNLSFAAGLTTTKTIRNSAGTGTCTMIFAGGVLTGGTC